MRDPTTNSFNTHSTPGNGQVTDYQKVKLPMPRENTHSTPYNGAIFFAIHQKEKTLALFLFALYNSLTTVH